VGKRGRPPFTTKSEYDEINSSGKGEKGEVELRLTRKVGGGGRVGNADGIGKEKGLVLEKGEGKNNNRQTLKERTPG